MKDFQNLNDEGLAVLSSQLVWEVEYYGSAGLFKAAFGADCSRDSEVIYVVVIVPLS